MVNTYPAYLNLSQIPTYLSVSAQTFSRLYHKYSCNHAISSKTASSSAARHTHPPLAHLLNPQSSDESLVAGAAEREARVGLGLGAPFGIELSTTYHTVSVTFREPAYLVTYPLRIWTWGRCVRIYTHLQTPTRVSTI